MIQLARRMHHPNFCSICSGLIQHAGRIQLCPSESFFTQELQLVKAAQVVRMICHVSIRLPVFHLILHYISLGSGDAAEDDIHAGLLWMSRLHTLEDAFANARAESHYEAVAARQGLPSMDEKRTEVAGQTNSEVGITQLHTSPRLPQLEAVDWSKYLLKNKDAEGYDFDTEREAKQLYMQHHPGKERLDRPFKIRMHYTACNGERQQGIKIALLRNIACRG